MNFKIENFEGPLDLLLQLAARHKVTLLEVRISLLIDQYLELLGTIGSDEMDPASEFVEMAARLVHMKSAALLPRQEQAKELERELVGQLMEYQLCKIAAAKLRDLLEGIFYAVRSPLTVKLPEEYAGVHEKTELSAAFMSLMGRGGEQQAAVERFEHLVTAPVVSVASRVIHILRGLRKGLVKSLQELFSKGSGRSESVATFLGLLELMKAGRVAVDADGTLLPGEKGKRSWM